MKRWQATYIAVVPYRSISGLLYCGMSTHSVFKAAPLRLPSNTFFMGVPDVLCNQGKGCALSCIEKPFHHQAQSYKDNQIRPAICSGTRGRIITSFCACMCQAMALTLLCMQLRAQCAAAAASKCTAAKHTRTMPFACTCNTSNMPPAAAVSILLALV